MSKKIKTRIILSSLSIIFFGLVFFVIAGPFISLYGIQSSLDKKQHQTLPRYIDFPMLQENVKLKVITQTQDALGFELSAGDNMLANFAKQFAYQIIDSAVTNAISPKGIAMMLSGEDLNEIIGGEKSQQDQQQIKNKKTTIEIFKESKFLYSDHQTFIFYLPVQAQENQQPGKLIFSRRGMLWKLSDIEFAQ